MLIAYISLLLFNFFLEKMNILKSLSMTVVTVAALSGVVAHATVIGTLGSDTGGSIFALTSNNVSGGVLATGTISDGTRPSNTVGAWLAGEPSTLGGAAVVTFGGLGVSDVSFEWGTPDSYNILAVTQANGTTTDFTTASLNFSNETYVNISETGSAIVSLAFESPTNQAFEAANFVTTTVPEPATIALLGLGFLGFAMARRKSGNNNA
jgi:hypothetical protein